MRYLYSLKASKHPARSWHLQSTKWQEIPRFKSGFTKRLSTFWRNTTTNSLTKRCKKWSIWNVSFTSQCEYIQCCLSSQKCAPNRTHCQNLMVRRNRWLLSQERLLKFRSFHCIMIQTIIQTQKYLIQIDSPKKNVASVTKVFIWRSAKDRECAQAFDSEWHRPRPVWWQLFATTRSRCRRKLSHSLWMYAPSCIKLEMDFGWILRREIRQHSD